MRVTLCRSCARLSGPTAVSNPTLLSDILCLTQIAGTLAAQVTATQSSFALALGDNFCEFAISLVLVTSLRHQNSVYCYDVTSHDL